MTANITTMDIGDGHEIVLCGDHFLEECHRCCVRFVEVNEDARERLTMDRAEKKKIKKGLLRKGTTVIMKDRSGSKPPHDYVATITGVTIADSYGLDDEVLCYVVKGKDELSERCLIWVEEMHDEWILEGVTFDEIKQIVWDGEEQEEESDEDSAPEA